MEVLTCQTCGFDWERPVVRGVKPRLCPTCRAAAKPGAVVPPPRSSDHLRRIDTTTPSYRVALAVTNYRLAIEEASAAIRLGRMAEALAALERVQAPARLVEGRRRPLVVA